MTTAIAPPEIDTEHINILINRATGIFAYEHTDAELDELARGLRDAYSALIDVVDTWAPRSWQKRLLAATRRCEGLLKADREASATAHWCRSFGTRLRYLAYAYTHPPKDLLERLAESGAVKEVA
ncbi:hypothetical protein [Streptomyces candidus]|uniref:Uncharacterized protein n=1 Tax=Streptomyces candidus TaxID=67283 RepID=A0A7X0HN30_9ACTN|nr:hypothetical protein [Streptomyces candidus]MBB6439414.1 hypothetical protein [Streptomyces candidus]GHH54832.1 hypothetical protein GCM10018773_58430 [Streptomyces candidus]